MNLSQTWQQFVAWISEHWLLGRLFISSLELLVLAVLAAVMLQLLRPRTPRLVALVWALVLAKPILSLLVASPISLLRLPTPAEPQLAGAPVMKAESIDHSIQPIPANDDPSFNDNSNGSQTKIHQPRQRIDHNQTGQIDEEQSLAVTSGHQRNIKPAAALPVVPAGERLNWLWSALTWLWLGGLIVMIVRAIFVRRQLARIFAACRAPSADVAAAYQQICGEMNIRRPPPLAITDQLESPALVGLWRAKVLLPEWLAAQANCVAGAGGAAEAPGAATGASLRSSPGHPKEKNRIGSSHSALAWSLRHELTHWRHGDLWLIRLRELARAVFFFHPAAWWAGKQLETAIEIACDRAVIATDAEAADYAHGLYKILDAVRNHRRVRLSGGLFATRSQIAHRLAMLMEAPLRLHARLSKPALCGVAILTAAVLTMGIGLKREAAGEDAKPNATNAADAPKSPADTEAAKSAPKTDEVAPQARTTKPTDAATEKPKASPAQAISEITDTVVDPSGKPVAGAQVELFSRQAADAASESTDRPALATTDANGAFRFPLKPASRTSRSIFPVFLVAKTANGDLQSAIDIQNPEAGRQIVAKLATAKNADVKVFDAQGKPVAGAKIALLGGVGGWCFDQGETDAEGTAKFRIPSDTRLFVVGLKSGVGFDYFTLAQQTAKNEDQSPQEVKLFLLRHRTMRIKAVDSANIPVAGLPIRLQSAFKGYGNIALNAANCPITETITDAQGIALIDWLPDAVSSLSLEVHSQEYSVPARYRNLLEFNATMKDDFFLPVYRRGTLSGTVMLPDGNPAADVMLEAIGFDANGQSSLTLITSKVDGTFTALVPGEEMYSIGVFEKEYAAPLTEGLIVREGKTLNDIKIQLSSGTIVEGTLTDKVDHNPVARQNVGISQEGKIPVPAELGSPDPGHVRPKAGIAYRSQTDAKGHYEFRVGPGQWNLDVRDSPLGPNSLKATIDVDSQPRIVKDFELPASKTTHLTGRVTDADDKPIAGVTAICRYLKSTVGGASQAVALTDADGKFDIVREPIPAMLIVQDRVARRAIGRIDDKQTEANVKVVPLPEIHGRLVDAQKAVVTNGVVVCRCSIVSEAPNGNFVIYDSAAKPDADGKFTFKDVFPGETYKISYGPSERQNRVIHEIKVVDGANIELGDLSNEAKTSGGSTDDEKTKSSQSEIPKNDLIAQAADAGKPTDVKPEGTNPARPVEAAGEKARTLTAQDGGRVSGHVYLPDGKPAAGIKLFAQSNTPTIAFAKAVTVADGSYEMIVPRTPAPIGQVVSVDDDRWAAPAKSGLVAVAGESIENIDFKLAEGTIVKGTLTEGAENKPAANHSVFLQLMADPAPAFRPGNPNSPRPREVQFSRMVKTDTAGQYRFCVGPGEYLLGAVATGPYGEIFRQGPRPSFTVKDEREIVQNYHLTDSESVNANPPITGRGRSGTGSPDAITIHGTVLDADGKPAKGREVRAVYQIGDGGGLRPRFAPTTADDGTFTLEGRQYPTMLVVKTVDGKQGGVARTDGKQTEVILHLAPSAPGHGQLLDENGKPVSGAAVLSVFAVQPGKLAAFGNYYSLSTTAEDGSYSLALLPGEENQLITFKDRTTAEVLKGFEELDAPPVASLRQGRGQGGRNNVLRGLETLTSVTPKDTSALELGKTRIPYHGPTIGAPEGKPMTLEFHLAEIDSAPGLTEATVADTENKIYLHPEILAEKKDFAAATRSTDSNRPLTLTLTLSEAAAKRVAAETAKHLSKPLAIVLNGHVISAPRLTSPISDKAQIAGLSEKEINAVVDAVGNANSAVGAKASDGKTK